MSKIPAFTPENLKARFAELKELQAAGEAALAPLQDARDKLIAKQTVDRDAADAKIREVRESHNLFAVSQEMAMIVRALGGIDRPARTAGGEASAEPVAEE